MLLIAKELFVIDSYLANEISDWQKIETRETSKRRESHKSLESLKTSARRFRIGMKDHHKVVVKSLTIVQKRILRGETLNLRHIGVGEINIEMILLRSMNVYFLPLMIVFLRSLSVFLTLGRIYCFIIVTTLYFSNENPIS